MSNEKGSFVKKAAILAIAGLIVRFIGFCYRVPLTNLISDEGNALYSAGYDIYNFLLILSSAGLPAAISKMVSERMALKQYKSAHNVFRVSLTFAAAAGLACAVILYAGAGALSKAIGFPDSLYVMQTLAPTVLIVALMSVYRGYFQGMNMMAPTAISQIVEQVFNAFFSVYLAYLFYVQLDMGIAMGAAGGTMGTGIGAAAGFLLILFLYILYKPYINRKMRMDQSDRGEDRSQLMKKLLFTAAPIILGSAVFSITNLVDMRMVMGRLLASGTFDQQRATELFGMLKGKYVTLTTLPVALSTALSTAAVPNIAASAALRDFGAVRHKVNTALRVSMILAIPAATGLGVLGVQIIHMLFPGSPSGGELLKLGAVSIVFLSLSQISTGILQGAGYVYKPAKHAVAGALVKIACNYFLIAIPSINIYGAVLSTILCYVVTSTLNLHAVMKHTKATIYFRNIFMKPILSSFVLGVGVYSAYYILYLLYPSNTIACLFAVLIGIFLYFFMMVLLKGFHKNDIMLIPGGKKLIPFLERNGLI